MQARVVRLPVRHPRGSYEVLVGPGALEEAAPSLQAWWRGRLAFLLSSPRVSNLWGAEVRSTMGAAAVVEKLEAPDGEEAKSLEVASSLWRAMLRRGGKRDSRLLVLGGGSLGDLGGFVAGCFLRGIEVAQVPTTLLAQVDASVGGKTALDLPEAKNCVGVFHYPAVVVAETRFLSSLGRRELCSGLVEAIKMAALLDPNLLERIEADLPRLLEGHAETLAPVVTGAVQAKIRVVESDPEERGERRLLNFGHTLGHALETTLGYEGLRHGEAVAYGMLFATRLAAKRRLPAAAADRLEGLVSRLDLPLLPGISVDELIAAMKRDKKARESGLTWVLPQEIGRGELVEDVGWQEVRAELASFLPAVERETSS